MDEKERTALEREVEAHMRRIERIQETLTDTEENLRHSLPLVEAATTRSPSANVVLVTAGFHMMRALALARPIFARSEGFRLFALPAHGPNTRPESWHLNARGRAVIAAELEKLRDMGLWPDAAPRPGLMKP